MTTFVDYAWWQVSPAQLRSMGFSGAMRYLSHDGSKDLSVPERDNLRAAGFDIGLVFESTANRAAQGPGAGRDDAASANSHADLLGYPKEATLWYAVDFDAAPFQVQGYFDGIAATGLRKHAPYGGVRVIDGVNYPGLGWQTAAWSGGHISGRAGLYQNGFHNTYDSNFVIVADFGQWRATEQPKEDDMPEAGQAVDAYMNGDGTGWVLDRWGGIDPVGGAPKPSDGPYWPGLDVARRLIIIDASKPSGYVLDMKGALHPFGGAPAPKTPAPYWP